MVSCSPLAGRANADDARRPDRASLCVDDHPRLVEAAVQERVVGRLRAGLSDDRPGPSASIRVRGKLASG